MDKVDKAAEVQATLLFERHLIEGMATATNMSEKRLVFAEMILLCEMYCEMLSDSSSRGEYGDNISDDGHF
jgi:hypothetical protein